MDHDQVLRTLRIRASDGLSESEVGVRREHGDGNRARCRRSDPDFDSAKRRASSSTVRPKRFSRGSGFFSNEVTRNPWIWAAVVLCVGLLIAAVYVSIPSAVLGTEEPRKEGWVRVLTLSFVPVVVSQGLRIITQIRRKIGRPGDVDRGGTA
ncbi:MAG: cation transporting ATPase C-terminal domain-containing protein [Polyangiales bacterium]